MVVAILSIYHVQARVLALLTAFMERDEVMDAAKCVTSESGRRPHDSSPELSPAWFRLVLENKPRRGRGEALRFFRPVIEEDVVD